MGLREARPLLIRAGDAPRRSPAPGVEFFEAVTFETTGAEELWFARATAEPGIKVPPHYHTCDSVAYLIRGRAAFEVGESLQERWEMEPGDYLYVPKEVIHTEETLGEKIAEFLVARDKRGGEAVYLAQS